MPAPEPAPDCPLCGGSSRFLTRAAGRRLFLCARCALCFVPSAEHVSIDAERARYLLHRNSADDAGYVRWLSQAVAALARHRDRLPDGARVLDYGSGPAPVLVGLLREAGFDAVGYDPFFAPDTDLVRPFDAVVSVETFEHFRRPREDVGRVVSLLRPGGLLVVMTSLLCDGLPELGRWHYACDGTHIAFYAAHTFEWLAAQGGLTILENDGRRVVVLRRNA